MMEFNTGDICLSDMLQTYEHTVIIHTEKWQAYKDDIDQFERDITEIGAIAQEMPNDVRERYNELQQMLTHMREDAADVKHQIELCCKKIELLKRFQ